MARTLATLALASALTACALGVNYPDPGGPRYAGGRTGAAGDGQSGAPPAPACLKLVSFNSEWADSIDAAIRLLRSEPNLRDADLLFLQEMDAPASARVADALGRAYVYYPAIRRRKTGEDFGNAIFSRWPIERDEKLVLPHGAIFGGNQRIATAGTITVDGVTVRLYSVHLGTPINMASRERGDQIEAILDDAEHFAHVIIAGDMNDAHVGDWARTRGYAWPTRHLPKTTMLGPIGFGTWDHVFLKGLTSPSGGAGVVTPPSPISDHKPIWATACFQ